VILQKTRRKALLAGLGLLGLGSLPLLMLTTLAPEMPGRAWIAAGIIMLLGLMSALAMIALMHRQAELRLMAMLAARSGHVWQTIHGPDLDDLRPADMIRPEMPPPKAPSPLMAGSDRHPSPDMLRTLWRGWHETPPSFFLVAPSGPLPDAARASGIRQLRQDDRGALLAATDTTPLFSRASLSPGDTSCLTAVARLEARARWLDTVSGALAPDHAASRDRPSGTEGRHRERPQGRGHQPGASP